VVVDICLMYELDLPIRRRKAVLSIEFGTISEDCSPSVGSTGRRPHVCSSVDDTMPTEQELIATCVLLLNAGHGRRSIAGRLRTLFRHPDVGACARSRLMPTAIEELLRFDTPLSLFEAGSFAGRDRRRHSGPRRRGGDAVRVREPRRPARSSADTSTLRVTWAAFLRSRIHYCLGAPLAKLEPGSLRDAVRACARLSWSTAW
jgi:hypothetical protein